MINFAPKRDFGDWLIDLDEETKDGLLECFLVRHSSAWERICNYAESGFVRLPLCPEECGDAAWNYVRGVMNKDVPELYDIQLDFQDYLAEDFNSIGPDYEEDFKGGM